MLEKLDSAARVAEVIPFSAIPQAESTAEPSIGHRPPGTSEVVATMVADVEMVAEFEELFRNRDDEEPDARAQRIKAGLKSKQVLGVATKFRKH